jgi:hypothetical protein
MKIKFTEHIRNPFDLDINKIGAKFPLWINILVWFEPADPWRNQAFFNRQRAYSSSTEYGIPLGTWTGGFLLL